MNPAECVEQAMWDLFWLPHHVRVVDRPELLYVASDRDDPVYNHVARLRASDDRVPALVDEVQREHPICSRWLVPDTFDTAALEHALLQHGYAPGDVHDVRTASVEGGRPPTPEGMQVERITTRAALKEAHTLTEAAFGHAMPRSDDELALALEQCADPAGRVHRFLVRDGDRAVSTGGLTTFVGFGFGLLWGGGTLPEARGRGAYSASITVRTRWARSLGLARVGLYARVVSSSPILARQGFAAGGRMTYWDRRGTP